MIRIDYYLLGYVKFEVKNDSISRVAERLRRGGVSAKISADGSFLSSLRLKKRIEELLSGVEYKVSPPMGLFGAFLRHRKRYGIICALIISLFLIFLSREVVWSVRVLDVDGDTENEIISDLADCGLSVGSFWRKTDLSRVEAATLMKSDSLAWISINRRGTVAYVSTVPKTVADSPQRGEVYSNVVAARDCVIEKITVKSGIALVKVGESVKRGEVLISGVIPTELGGGFCYAEGSVIGRYGDAVTSFVPSEVSEKVYLTPTTSKISLNFFGNKINIFKKYGNLTASCDIIEKNKQFSLFGAQLPISFSFEECVEYTELVRIRDSGELAELCSDLLARSIASATVGRELVSVRCDGIFTDGGYQMTADMIVRGEVANTVEFLRE